MPTTIHNGHGDVVAHDADPNLVDRVIARLGTHYRGRWDHLALDAAATDVLDEQAVAVGDTHTPTPREVAALAAAAQARTEAGTA